MSKRQETHDRSVPLKPRERRASARIRLTLDVAVPVLVRHSTPVLEAGERIQWGVARNVSEGGMLIELPDPPAIGQEVEISFPGIPGSVDAPEQAVLRGEVRHQMKWNYSRENDRKYLSAIGVKFLKDHEHAQPAPMGWVH